MSFKSMAASVPDAKKKPVKPGSKLTLLPKVEDHVREAVSNFIKATTDMKEAKAKVEEFGEVIIDSAIEIQNKEGFEGSYSKSYLIPGKVEKGKEPQLIQYSRSDKFSSFDDTVEASLKKTLGAVTFNRLFEKDLTLQIAPEVLKDRAKSKELAALLTAAFGDRIGEFFVKTTFWSAKEGLDTAQFSLGATPEERKEKYEALQLQIKQNRPALKLT